MLNILNELNIISEILLEKYYDYNFEEVKKCIDYEISIYKNLSIKQLNQLVKYVEDLEIKLDSFRYENIEISPNINDKLILRHILNRINQALNRTYYLEKNRKIEKEIYRVSNDKIIVMQNIAGALSELDEKILANIETKYIFFLITDQSINDFTKGSIINNSLYVNPYLEEKLFKNAVKAVNVNEYIKNEDNLYNNLYDNVKIEYNKFLKDYCLNTIEYMINSLETENNQLLIKLKELYIRTLLNYLDLEDIKALEEKYSNVILNNNLLISNELKKNIFDKTSEDKKTIKYIKNY